MIQGLNFWDAKLCSIKDQSKISRAIHNHLQNVLEKLLKLRKGFNHKRNINRIYKEKLRYNCRTQDLRS